MTTVPYYVYDLLEGNGYRWNYGPIGGAGDPVGTPATITYAWQTSGLAPNGDTVVGFSPSQQAAIQLALSYIEQLCNVTFTLIASTAAADITFGFDQTNTGGTGESGITYWNTQNFGGPSVLTQANVYLNNVSTNADLTAGFLTSASVNAGTPEGGFGWVTVLHEIGHALGLKHPFDENSTGDSGSVLDTTFPAQDVKLYSLMSYTESPDSGYLDKSQNLIFNLESRTFSMFDIAALQYLYGANASPSLAVLQSIFDVGGDSITGSPGAFSYTLSPSTGIFATIADDGTHDTLNLASFTLGCSINLNSGAFSTLGMAVNAVPAPAIDPFAPPSPFAAYSGTNALAIAFGTTVTTCIAGSGNDTIIGNAANDVLMGGGGTNTIMGGGGVDTAAYSAARANYSIGFSAGAVKVTGNGSNDTLTRIQYLQFADGTIKVPYRVADLTGNGTSDILWRNGVNGDTVAFVMSGGNVASTTDIGPISTAWSVAGIGDFNDDGIADILWRNTVTGDDVIFFMSGATVASSADIGPVGTAWSVVSVNDFNGDAVSDILWRNSNTGDTVLFLMSGSTIVATPDLGVIGSAWKIAGTGDFNGDGSADILWRNSTNGDTVIFDLHNGSVSSVTDIGTIGTAWSVAGVGDFNGDGTSDLLWRNSVTGDTVLFLMSHNGITASADLGIVGTAWTVAQIGDFNNDGRADLLWRNSSTGATIVFEMNGTSLIATPSLGSIGTAWSVQNPTLAS
jgi:hypothetical protein